LIGVAGLASSIAGCTDSGGDGGDGGMDGGDGSGGATSPTSTDSSAPTGTPTPAEEGTPADSGAETPEPTEAETVESTEQNTPEPTAAEQSTPTEGSGSGSDGVTATVSLVVRQSRSNVDKFRTLRTRFEALELVKADGTTVRLDDTTQEVDLTELGPGGSVDLFETTVPAGSYNEAKLYLPIQDATLSDGSDPEFDRTVPVSRETRGDPVEVRGGPVRINATVALLRIAGDGPWTYTLGWGVR
jgi:hypothetical protein